MRGVVGGGCQTGNKQIVMFFFFLTINDILRNIFVLFLSLLCVLGSPREEGGTLFAS